MGGEGREGRGRRKEKKRGGGGGERKGEKGRGRRGRRRKEGGGGGGRRRKEGGRENICTHTHPLFSSPLPTLVIQLCPQVAASHDLPIQLPNRLPPVAAMSKGH